MKRLAFLLLLGATNCRTSLPGASLSGRVVVSGESELAGIAVSAVGPQAASTHTDAGGNYYLDGLVDGVYTVTATGRSTVEGSASTQVAANGPLAVPDLILTPAGRLHGRATRGGSASGNGGIFVTAGDASAITNDRGDYHFDALPTGSYDLSASVAGFQPASLIGQPIKWDQLSEAPQMDLTIDPARGALRLRGIALLFGRANHAGTTVTLTGTGLQAVTAADGSWEIDGVAEGSYALSLENGSYRETVPQVLALAGGDGMVEDGALYPLPDSPLTLYPLPRIAGPGTGGFTLSSDGKRLLYTDPVAKHLVMVRTDGSGSVDLTGGPYDDLVGFTADGSQIAYFLGKQLMVVSSDGGNARVAANNAGAVLLSSDNQSFAYFGTDPVSGNAAFYAGDLGGGKPFLIESSPDLHDWAWSADGKHLLYRTGVDNNYTTGTVKLYTAGSAPVTIAGGTVAPQLSADRRHALLLTNCGDSLYFNCTLVAVDLTSGATTTIASQVVLNAAFADNDRIVYQQMNNDHDELLELRALSLSGAVAPTDFGKSNGYYLSGDGSTLLWDACDTMTCTLMTQPLSGASAARAWGQSFYGFSVSDDGLELVYATAKLPAPASLLTSLGGTPLPLGVSVNDFYSLRFTSDGTHLLYFDNYDSTGNRVSLLSTRNGSSVTLADHANVLKPSPDGHNLAMAVPNSDGGLTLTTAPLDGTLPSVVVDRLVSFQWNDQRKLVLTRQGTPAPYRFQDGFYTWSL